MTLKELEERMTASDKTQADHTLILTDLQAGIQLILNRLDAIEHPPPPPQPPNQPPIHGRPIRLDFPRFEGIEPESWLFQAEQFFTLNPLPPEQRVTMASIHLRGDAVAWYRWLRNSLGDDLTWRQFSTALCKRFGSRKNLDPMSALSKLTQKGTVSSYITEFETMINLVHGLDEPHQVSLFLSGLRADIQAGVRLLSPTGLSHAFELALCQEDAITATKAFASSATNQRTPGRPSPSPPKPLPGNSALPTGVKRLTWAEQQQRRAKGLCFNCDETYKPGHRCATPQLLLMDAYTADQDFPDDPDAADDSLQISLHALTGSTGCSTMRAFAQIKNAALSVLIDSGSTHNFINPRAARTCGLSVQPHSGLQVMVADGEFLPTKGACLQVPVLLQGFDFSTDFLLLDVRGCDIVLGTQWLRTLGRVMFDFTQLIMQFTQQGVIHTIIGNGSPLVRLIDTPSMSRVIQTEGQVLLLSLEPQGCGEPDDKFYLRPQQKAIQQLLFQFRDVFGIPSSLPPPRSHDHHIPLLPGSAPVSVRPYRYPHFQKAEIEKVVQELRATGFIRPSHSPFSSPVLLVKKKDGSLRMCVDYRALNTITIKDRFPIPVVDELLDELQSATVFSKLDLRAGYHQIRVHESDIPKTAFRTHDGHYEFLVMPFGLSNAPSTFQSLMNDIFRPYLRKFVLVFFDDILVYSSDEANHFQHLATVLQTLRQNQLFVKASKCSFGQSSIAYLGHIIDAFGVSVDPDKIAAVTSWPTPTTLKGLRGFLGLTGYYRKFVKDYGNISRPLTQLLKKDAFAWSTEAAAAFDQLKTAMTTTPVLALPNFAADFYIETDASGFGIGAALMQGGRPIAYLSKALSGTKLNLSIYDKEMLAVIAAVHKWRPYLVGRHFKIFTDHRTLKYFNAQRLSSAEQQKWVSKLLGYDYEICFRPGKHNQSADALSRLPQPELSALSEPIMGSLTEIAAECRSHPSMQSIIIGLQSDPSSKRFFTLQDNILRYKGRIVVAPGSSWCARLLEEYHASPTAGHSGFLRTYKRLQTGFYWQGMKADIKHFVAHCEVCQRNKAEAVAPPGLLNPLPVPDDVWVDISMDFIEGLPRSNHKTVILVVVDRLSKYAHFISLAHPYTASKVADVFVREIVRLHGPPRSIVSDRDPIFIGNFWESFFALQQTKLCRSSAYHPQSDGQTEVTNRTLECYLRCFAGDRPSSWVSCLPWAEWWYNTTYHSAIKMTPFEALYSRPPPSISAYVPGSSAVHAVDVALRSRDVTLACLKDNMVAAQARMKRLADSHRTERTFRVGDWVYLRLQPYRQLTAATQSYGKLSPKFHGPFRVSQRIGEVAYKLDLPAQCRIHPVFHVSLLKSSLGAHNQTSSTLPVQPDRAIWLPLRVLDTRPAAGTAAPEWLIQWEGHSEDEATWENSVDLLARYPFFKACGQAFSQRRGDDGNPTLPQPRPMLTYTRRNKK